MEQSGKYYMIVFEDSDRDFLMFDSKDAALLAYRSLLVSWNCHLFEQIMMNGVDV